MLSGTLLSQAQSQLSFFPQHTRVVAADLLAFLFLSPGKLRMLIPFAGKKKKREGGEGNFPCMSRKGCIVIGSFGLGALENPSENGLNMKTTVL